MMYSGTQDVEYAGIIQIARLLASDGFTATYLQYCYIYLGVRRNTNVKGGKAYPLGCNCGGVVDVGEKAVC